MIGTRPAVSEIATKAVKIALVLILLAAVWHPMAAAAKYQESTVSNGGALVGSVMLQGAAPPPRMIKVTKDTKACGRTVLDESLMVSKGGGIVNAVVEIQGIGKGKKWALSKSFVYDQKNCRFAPHVMVVMPRARGEVHNSDSVKHNVHTVSKGIFNVNKSLAPGKSLKVKRNKIRKAGKIRVKCDLHKWMGGWWIVAASPYIALTDDAGKFEIRNIPPGKYTVTIWQERLGETTRQVDIKPGVTFKLPVSMKLKG